MKDRFDMEKYSFQFNHRGNGNITCYSGKTGYDNGTPWAKIGSTNAIKHYSESQIDAVLNAIKSQEGIKTSLNYEKMWKELKRAALTDLSMLGDPKTIIEYADIQRMATAKLIQQTMIKIEQESNNGS